MKTLLIPLAICLALLTAGCASTPDYEAWARAVEAQHKYAATAVSGCDNDLCRYVVTQEIAANAIKAPRQELHPAWQSFFSVLDTVATLGLSGHFGVKNSEVWAGVTTSVVGSFAGMDRSYTDNSVNVGRDQIGGNRVVDNSNNSDNSTNAGGDYAGRDLYGESCVGPNCRYDSAGPIDESDNSTTDNSDNSNNSDNSTTPDAED